MEFWLQLDADIEKQAACEHRCLGMAWAADSGRCADCGASLTSEEWEAGDW